jgi:hypothetical protein
MVLGNQNQALLKLWGVVLLMTVLTYLVLDNLPSYVQRIPPNYVFYFVFLLLIILALLTAAVLLDAVMAYAEKWNIMGEFREYLNILLASGTAGFIVLLFDDVEVQTSPDLLSPAFWIGMIAQASFIILIAFMFITMTFPIYHHLNRKR